MKKARNSKCKELRPEYDFASMGGGVRGKYAGDANAHVSLVLLDPDVAVAFPTAQAVNDALRALLQAAACVCPGHTRSSAASERPGAKTRARAKPRAQAKGRVSAKPRAGETPRVSSRPGI